MREKFTRPTHEDRRLNSLRSPLFGTTQLRLPLAGRVCSFDKVPRHDFREHRKRKTTIMISCYLFVFFLVWREELKQCCLVTRSSEFHVCLRVGVFFSFFFVFFTSQVRGVSYFLPAAVVG